MKGGGRDTSVTGFLAPNRNLPPLLPTSTPNKTNQLGSRVFCMEIKKKIDFFLSPSPFRPANIVAKIPNLIQSVQFFPAPTIPSLVHFYRIEFESVIETSKDKEIKQRV